MLIICQSHKRSSPFANHPKATLLVLNTQLLPTEANDSRVTLRKYTQACTKGFLCFTVHQDQIAKRELIVFRVIHSSNASAMFEMAAIRIFRPPYVFKNEVLLFCRASMMNHMTFRMRVVSYVYMGSVRVLLPPPAVLKHALKYVPLSSVIPSDNNCSHI